MTPATGVYPIAGNTYYYYYYYYYKTRHFDSSDKKQRRTPTYSIQAFATNYLPSSNPSYLTQNTFKTLLGRYMMPIHRCPFYRVPELEGFIA